MRDENIEYEYEDEPKKKGGLRWWGKLLITFFSLVIGIPLVVVIVLYACFYNADIVKVEHNDEFVLEERMKQRFVVAVDDTGDKTLTDYGIVDMRLSEQDLNDLLYASLNEMLSKVNLVTGYGVEIKGDVCYLMASANLYDVFKTKVILGLNIALTEDEEGDMAFILSIRSATIGNIGGAEKIAKDNIEKFISASDINKAFAKAGVHMKVDLKQLKLTYKAVDLVTDIFKYLDDGGISITGNMALYKEVLDHLVEKKNLTLSTADKSIGAKFDLSPYHVNTTLGNPADSQPVIDYKACAEYMEYLLDNHYLTDEDPVDEFITYLVKGYYRKDGTTKTDKTVCNRIDKMIESKGDDFLKDAKFGTVFADGIPSIRDGADHYIPAWYSNIFDPDGDPSNGEADSDEMVDFNEDLIDNYDDLLVGGTLVADIFDESLTDRLRCSALFARSYPLRDNNGGSWNVNHISIDDFYCNVLDNRFIIGTGFSVNGYETTVLIATSLDGTQPDNTGHSYVFTIDDVYIGDTIVKENLRKMMFEQVGNALSSNSAFNDYLSFDLEHSKMTLSLEPVRDILETEVADPTDRETALNYFDDARFSIELKGSSIADNGKISIKVK